MAGRHVDRIINKGELHFAIPNRKNIIRANACYLPYKDSEIDFILSSHCFPFWFTDAKLMREAFVEMHRVL